MKENIEKNNEFVQEEVLKEEMERDESLGMKPDFNSEEEEAAFEEAEDVKWSDLKELAIGAVQASHDCIGFFMNLKEKYAVIIEQDEKIKKQFRGVSALLTELLGNVERVASQHSTVSPSGEYIFRDDKEGETLSFEDGEIIVKLGLEYQKIISAAQELITESIPMLTVNILQVLKINNKTDIPSENIEEFARCIKEGDVAGLVSLAALGEAKKDGDEEKEEVK